MVSGARCIKSEPQNKHPELYGGDIRGLKGLEPRLYEKGAETLQEYLCVTSSTVSREKC